MRQGHKLHAPGLSCIWRGFLAWDTLQDNTDDSIIDKVETSLERKEHFSQFQDTIDALPCQTHLSVCLWIMDPHSRAPKKNTSHGNEVLPQDTTHLTQRQYYQRRSLRQDPAGNRTTRRPHTIVKRRRQMFYGHASRSSGLAKTILHGTAKGKKTRQTEKEYVGRQHQGMDKSWVRQVQEGGGEQRKMEESGCMWSHLWCPNNRRS